MNLFSSSREIKASEKVTRTDRYFDGVKIRIFIYFSIIVGDEMSSTIAVYYSYR